MSKKYEFTGETKVNKQGKTLHRIRSLVEFDEVRVGSIGGWIEGEHNLSHEGKAWVESNAEVFDRAVVRDNARVTGSAIVCEYAVIHDNAWVHDFSTVKGSAEIGGTCKTFGWCEIKGQSRLRGNVQVGEEAVISGYISLTGDDVIKGTARISKKDDYSSVRGFGSCGRTTTFFRCSDDMIRVVCGCFYGTIDEFIERVKETRIGKVSREYLIIAELMKLHFEGGVSVWNS